MRQRLNRNERERIRGKYGSNLLFRVLRNTVTNLSAGTKFRLSPEEVFLWSLVELDEMKTTSPKDYLLSARSLLNDVQNDIRDMSAAEVPDGECSLMASELLSVLVLCLNCCQSSDYVNLQLALTIQLPAEQSQEITASLMHDVRRVGEDDFIRYIVSYVSDTSEEVKLSHEIDAMLNEQKETEVAVSPVVPLPRSSLRIAEGKQTSVLVVLDAMYKAGWFAKNDGSKATNRDKTLNEILQLAFNQEGSANISQLLSSPNNRYGKAPSEYVKELLQYVKK